MCFVVVNLGGGLKGGGGILMLMCWNSTSLFVSIILLLNIQKALPINWLASIHPCPFPRATSQAHPYWGSTFNKMDNSLLGRKCSWNTLFTVVREVKWTGCRVIQDRKIKKIPLPLYYWKSPNELPSSHSHVWHTPTCLSETIAGNRRTCVSSIPGNSMGGFVLLRKKHRTNQDKIGSYRKK